MAHVLAVDIGGTKLAAGMVDGDGNLTYRAHRPTADAARDAESLYAALLELASGVLEDHAAPVTAIGVGCGGPGRDRHRLVSPLNIPVWRDFPLRERLGADLGLRCFVDNDAKALALGEGWTGAAVGVPNYAAIVVSTGIGGGIVLNGRLLEGADGNAGHIGHVFVEPGGRADANGAKGLLEGSASGTALADLLGAPPAEADHATRVRVGVLVGRAVASVANLLDLQLAVVAGSVALGFADTFFASAQATVDAFCRLDFSRGTRIVPAGLGERGPLVGAGAVAWRALDGSFPIG